MSDSTDVTSCVTSNETHIPTTAATSTSRVALTTNQARTLAESLLNAADKAAPGQNVQLTRSTTGLQAVAR